MIATKCSSYSWLLDAYGCSAKGVRIGYEAGASTWLGDHYLTKRRAHLNTVNLNLIKKPDRVTLQSLHVECDKGIAFFAEPGSVALCVRADGRKLVGAKQLSVLVETKGLSSRR